MLVGNTNGGGRRRGLACVLVAVLLSAAAGCHPAPPATPEPLAPQPSTQPPINTLVHIDNADPTLPLALYRIELELSGERYRRLVGSGTGIMAEKEDRSSPLDDVHVTVQTMVCLAPCDLLVGSFPGQKFFLGGDGIVPSTELRLDPGLGNVRIDAKPKSSAWKYGGDTLVALGAVGVFVGTILVVSGVVNSSPGATAIGGGTLGAGAGVLGGGIGLLVVGKTRFILRPPTVAWRF